MNDIEKREIFDNLCKLPLYLMRSLGIDLLDDVRWRPYFRLFRFYGIFSLCCGSIFISTNIRTLIDLAQETNRDYTSITKGITNTIYVIGNTIKVAYVLRQHKRIEALLKQFREIFPKSDGERGVNVEPMTTYFWPKWVTSLNVFYIIIGCILCFNPPFTSLAIYCYQLLTRPLDEAQFPYLRVSIIKFTSHDNEPLTYFIISIIEYASGHIGIGITSTDLWAILFIMHLSMHYDDLNTTLRNHEPQDTIRLSKIDQKFITNFVRRHNLLLK